MSGAPANQGKKIFPKGQGNLGVLLNVRSSWSRTHRKSTLLVAERDSNLILIDNERGPRGKEEKGGGGGNSAHNSTRRWFFLSRARCGGLLQKERTGEMKVLRPGAMDGGVGRSANVEVALAKKGAIPFSIRGRSTGAAAQGSQSSSKWMERRENGRPFC